MKPIHNESVNKQLINIIVDKSNAIEELKTKIDIKKENNEIEKLTLNLNNVIIVSRRKDNYINTTQLCQAGDKQFNDWLCLDNTKELINVVSKNGGDNDVAISASQLLDINKGS